MFCIMNTQESYSYANIGMNQIMNRMNESIKKNHITIVLWQINIIKKENNSKYICHVEVFQPNECRAKIACANHKIASCSAKHA